jgi:hypothetical protein
MTPKQSYAHDAAGRSICAISDTSFGPHRCLPIKSPSIYHRVKWEALAAPKHFGGLGFVDTRSMNTVLLAKWIFKLDRGGNNMALEVVRRKYLEDKSFCSINFRKPD